LPTKKFNHLTTPIHHKKTEAFSHENAEKIMCWFGMFWSFLIPQLGRFGSCVFALMFLYERKEAKEEKLLFFFSRSEVTQLKVGQHSRMYEKSQKPKNYGRNVLQLLVLGIIQLQPELGGDGRELKEAARLIHPPPHLPHTTLPPITHPPLTSRNFFFCDNTP
jgi:hypothetical protein